MVTATIITTIIAVIGALIAWYTFFKKLQITATCNVVDSKPPIIGLRIKIYPPTYSATLKSVKFDYPILRVERPDGHITGSITEIELYSSIAAHIPILSGTTKTNPISFTVWIIDKTYNPARDIFTAKFHRRNGTLKIKKKTFQTEKQKQLNSRIDNQT